MMENSNTLLLEPLLIAQATPKKNRNGEEFQPPGWSVDFSHDLPVYWPFRSIITGRDSGGMASSALTSAWPTKRLRWGNSNSNVVTGGVLDVENMSNG